jgi:hypothetical protein
VAWKAFSACGDKPRAEAELHEINEQAAAGRPR